MIRNAVAVGLMFAALAVEAQMSSCEICDARKEDEGNSATTNPLNPCGMDCPDHVLYNTRVIAPEALPVDGWYTYLVGTTLYWSRIREFAPREVPGVTAKRAHIHWDGEWILYFGTDFRLKVVKRDGSGKTDLGLTTSGGLGWYTASPKGHELFYTEGSATVKAALITGLDTGSPRTGTVRTVGAGVGTLTPTTELDVSGAYIYGRMSGSRNPWYGGKNAGTLFHIPDGGNGTAGKSDGYYVNCPYNCALTLNPAGTLMASNYGRCYHDCTPENHKGFSVVRCRNNDDGEICVHDWMLDRARGAERVVWCPEKYDDKNLRAGTWRDQEFHHWNWSNHESYLVGVHMRRDPYGAWLVDWKTGDWSLLTDRDIKATFPSAYIEGATGVETARTVPSRPEAGARTGYAAHQSEGVLHLRVSARPGSRLEIVDAGGRTVRSLITRSAEGTIRFPSVSRGVYLVKVTEGDAVCYRRISVCR